MDPSTSEFAYTLPDGTKRKVVASEDRKEVSVWQRDESVKSWDKISSRFVTAEDLLYACLERRSETAPSKRQQAIQKQLADGVVRGVAIPSPLLAYPPFVSALGLWLEGRSQKGALPTGVALVKTFHKLREWGPARATAALEFSAEQGYTGVFEPKSSGSQKAAPQRHGHTDANAAKLREKMGR